MNWLLIAVLVVLIVFTFQGYHKGFLQIIFSLVSVILMLVLVAYATPHIATFLEDNTTIHERIQTACETRLHEKVAENLTDIGQTDDTQGDDAQQDVSSTNEAQITIDRENDAQSEDGQTDGIWANIEQTGGEQTDGAQENVTQQDTNPSEDNLTSSADVLSKAGITLPSTLQESLISKGTEAADYLLDQSGFYTQTANDIADIIVRGLSFFIALAVVGIFLKMIAKLLNLFTKLPVIHGINRLLGLLAGLLKGLIWVWIFMYVVAICCTNQFGEAMMGYINQSTFLLYLYQNNGVLQFVSIFI